MIRVKANNLGKRYKIYKRPIDSLKEALFRKSYHDKVDAISGITFQLREGETLGIIGNNGAGKSTLLKLLAGTIQPSAGSRVIHGRLTAILELGSGFHPEFSGIENARMGCALIGLNNQEIKAAIPKIKAFSELGDFFYRPVKTYSSGMYVRLAFSVITTVDPDVLVVDEALSVGDQHFQKKSLDRMQYFRDSGKTIIFCSHNLYQVKELCDQAIWIENGQMMEYGPAKQVVDNYQDSIRSQNNVDKSPYTEAKQSSVLDNSITDVQLNGERQNDNFLTNHLFLINVKLQLTTVGPEQAHVGIVIMRNDHVHCYGVSTHIDQVQLDKIDHDSYEVNLRFKHLQLLSGRYYLCIYLLDGDAMHIYDYRENCCNFTVRNSSKEVGIARLAHDWESS